MTVCNPVTPSSLVTLTCLISTLFISRFSLGFSELFVSNTMFLDYEIFRTNLFLATHSETYCSSLLSVAVILLAVVADMYSVVIRIHRHTGFTQGQCDMPLVKIEKCKGPRQLPGEFLILLGLFCRGFH